MPTVEAADGSRFVRVSDPDFEPLYFDPAAVAAIVGRPEGKYRLHLVGGQTIELAAPIAAAVLKQLGLPVPRAPKAKRHGDGETRRREPKVKRPAKAEPKGAIASAAAAIAGFLS